MKPVNHSHERTDVLKGKRTPFDVLRLYPPHDETLMGALDSRVSVDADQPFLYFRARTYTRGEFRDAVLRMARSLVARGIRPGDRIGVMSRNHEGHLLLLFAAARIGAIMVPTNPEFGIDEVRYVFGKAEVSAIACSPECLATARAASAGFSNAPWVLLFDGEDATACALSALVSEDADVTLPPNPPADTNCLIIFTSGSAGFVKGALHTQRNVILAGEANVARLWLQPSDRMMTLLPLFHINALFYSVAGALAAGACCILMERFSAANFWEQAVETGATTVNIIEAIGRILVARPRGEFRSEHKIQSVYGVRPDIREHFRAHFHIPVLVSGFGMTEIPGVFCSRIEGPDIDSTMGFIGRHPDPLRRWASCRVVDDDGRDVPDGEDGKLWGQASHRHEGLFPRRRADGGLVRR